MITDSKESNDHYVFPIEYLMEIQEVSSVLQKIKQVSVTDSDQTNTDVRLFNEIDKRGVFTVQWIMHKRIDNPTAVQDDDVPQEFEKIKL